jgi:serine/threonine protein phosphatase PrpC
MIEISYGVALNYPGDNTPGFDAIYLSPDTGVFVLCDGANSTSLGGRCSSMCAPLLGELLALDFPNAIKAFEKAHEAIQEQLSNAACTAISIQARENLLQLCSCGDSQIDLFRYRPFLGWKNELSTQLDLLEDGNPSQLMGSSAYQSPNTILIKNPGVTCAMLMSDGVHRYIPRNHRLKTLKTLISKQPSNEDLTYLAHTLSQQALSAGSQDDISIAIIWIRSSQKNEQ